MNVIRNIFARHYAGFFLSFCQSSPVNNGRSQNDKGVFHKQQT